MLTKGEQTRERILDAAQCLILERGYAGVSVDQLLSGLGLTKGAFFHHFKNKKDLARSLIQRYSDEGVSLFEENMARAKKLSDDRGYSLSQTFRSRIGTTAGILLSSATPAQVMDRRTKAVESTSSSTPRAVVK